MGYKDKNKAREYGRLWYYKNREKRIKYQRDYDKKNKHKKRLYDLKRWASRKEKNHLQRYAGKNFTEILKRKYKGCQICGSKIKLEIHHFRYTKSIKDCALLCQKCHKIIHRKSHITKSHSQC